MRRSSSIAVPALALAIGSLLSACDIGDGTTLQAPVAPTTTAPIDTTPLPSLPLAADTVLVDTVLVGDDSLDDTALDDTADIGDLEPFRVIAPWADGGPVDARYTCDGVGDAPGIAWTGVPDGTVELALSLVDESNLSGERPFVHWMVAGIDPAVGEFVPEDPPPGAFEAINSSGDVGYSGLCPDPGSTGVYVLRLFAVGQQVESGFDAPAADVLDVVEAVSFDIATVSGTLTR